MNEGTVVGWDGSLEAEQALPTVVVAPGCLV